MSIRTESGVASGITTDTEIETGAKKISLLLDLDAMQIHTAAIPFDMVKKKQLLVYYCPQVFEFTTDTFLKTLRQWIKFCFFPKMRF